VCQHLRSRVLDSRPLQGFVKARRRRLECKVCGARYSTVEIPVDLVPPAPGQGLADQVSAIKAIMESGLTLTEIKNFIAAARRR